MSAPHRVEISLTRRPAVSQGAWKKCKAQE